MAGCLASLVLALPAFAGSETTLLRPRAISYAPSGSSVLNIQRDWSSLTLNLLAPQGQRRLGGLGMGQGFTHLTLGYAGNDSQRDISVSLGQAWRQAVSDSMIIGVNAYLDFGQQPISHQIMSQATLGVEYESASGYGMGQGNLVFGSNLYLPFADYTAPRFGLDGWVPRRGMDSYIALTRSPRAGLTYGTRLSVFHYPASTYRAARGIGTFSVTGEMTRGLPEGSALSADLTGRYTPGEPLTPRLELEYRQQLVPPAPQGQQVVGPLRPSRDCDIVEGDTRLERLDCGRSQYEATRRHQVYRPHGRDTEAAVTVPAPRRRLGYGGFYVP